MDIFGYFKLLLSARYCSNDYNSKLVGNKIVFDYNKFEIAEGIQKLMGFLGTKEHIDGGP